MWKSHEIPPISAGESSKVPDFTGGFFHFEGKLGTWPGLTEAKVGTIGQDA